MIKKTKTNIFKNREIEERWGVNERKEKIKYLLEYAQKNKIEPIYLDGNKEYRYKNYFEENKF